MSLFEYTTHTFEFSIQLSSISAGTELCTNEGLTQLCKYDKCKLVEIFAGNI